MYIYHVYTILYLNKVESDARHILYETLLEYYYNYNHRPEYVDPHFIAACT